MDRDGERERLRCSDKKRQKLSPWAQTDTHRKQFSRKREKEERREGEQITEAQPKPAKKMRPEQSGDATHGRKREVGEKKKKNNSKNSRTKKKKKANAP